MNFKPLQDRILIKRIAQENKTKSGIIIPDTAKEKPMYGIVIEVGMGRKSETGILQQIEVKKGDKILFAKWSGIEIKLNDEEYLIMKESDILGKLI